MRLGRREFLRLFGSALGALAAAPSERRGATTAAGIHRQTAGEGLAPLLSVLRGPPTPFKEYPDVPRLTLPSPPEASTPFANVVRGGRAPTAFAPERLELAELARLLHLTNGVTERSGTGETRRAAPSAGALYAGEVYVVCERVAELAPGIYYFAVLDHELVAMRRGRFLGEVAAALEDPASLENAAAVVLLTNVFHRYQSRYGARGYRYAWLDSGHQSENLRLAAAAGGLAVRSPLRFEDDRLHALLEIDGREEAVCALHAVGRRAERPSDTSARMRHLVEKQNAQPAALRAGSPATERYHEATKLVAGTSPALQPYARPALAAPRQPSRALARSRTPSTSVDACIRVRRSTREFEEQPLSLDELGFVLEMAGSAGGERSAELELLLAVSRVQDLAPGVYTYDRRAHALTHLQHGDPSRELERACLGQHKARRAAAAFVSVAEPSRSAASAGERVYRDLLLEAGATAERIYLGAEARGLTARNLSAYHDDELDALLGLAADERVSLHLTLLGHGD